MVSILSFSARVGVSSLARGPAVMRRPPYSSRALGGLVAAGVIFYLKRQLTRVSLGKHVLKCPLILEVEHNGIKKNTYKLLNTL